MPGRAASTSCWPPRSATPSLPPPSRSRRWRSASTRRGTRRCSCPARSRGSTPPTCCSPHGRSTRRALRIGLGNELVERAELLPRALAAADAIAGNAPLAVRETRRGLRELLHLSLEQAYARQEQIGSPLRRTEDAAEGARAFVEKRPPVRKGR